MHEREILKTADVTDALLTDMVAELLHQPSEAVVLLESSAEEVDYTIPSITTAGRYWVTGSALAGGSHQPFRMLVKHVQSWSRSPLFAGVPPEMAEIAEAGVPWRTEPLAYRSDLAGRLPSGLRMPRSLGVFDIDEKSASIWMEAFTPLSTVWDLDRYSKAAHLLGRLAANPRVRERANVGETAWTVRVYLDGRLRNQVIPMLFDEGIWRHPLIAGAFSSALRDRLRAAAARAEDLVDELVSLPLGTAHGDACPNNLLVTAEHDGFVLIDYGFWTEAPIGMDLAQLLVGDIQLGRRSASTLQETEDAIIGAYMTGLRLEGDTTAEATVRRAHAIQLMLFTGLSSLPFDRLGEDLTPALHDMAAEQASIARFSLDLLDQTEPQRGRKPSL